MPKDNFKCIPKRKLNTHKGDYGHLFVLAGSLNYSGAAYLTAQAAIRSGCGVVTLGFPKILFRAMTIKLTEVIKMPLNETKDGTIDLSEGKVILEFSQKASALAIGPGLSVNKRTVLLIRKILPKLDKPFVLDADGINAISGNLEIFRKISVPYIITPHPGEMSRLTGRKIPEIQKNRIDVALSFAKMYNAVVVLKGHRTVVASPSGGIYINNTGNPGMAKAGMGDVLTGMIGSFLAQGMDVYKSARLGVYLHGLAGDIAVKKVSESSLIASDVLEKIPEAFKKI